MASNVASMTGKSNFNQTKTGGFSPVSGGVQKLTSDFLTTIFPENTYALVARLLNIRTKKTAENRLGGDRKFSADEIAMIIFSEHGARYLAYLAKHVEKHPDWYRVHEPLMELADAEKLQLAARSKAAKILRRAVDADDSLTATIRRAQAVSIQDPEFHSGTLDAFSAMARVFVGPMAQAKGKRK